MDSKQQTRVEFECVGGNGIDGGGGGVRLVVRFTIV